MPRGSRRWRVPAYQVRELVDELRGRGVRYGAARAMLPQRLAHAVLLLMEGSGDSPDDRVQDQVGVGWVLLGGAVIVAVVWFVGRDAHLPREVPTPFERSAKPQG